MRKRKLRRELWSPGADEFAFQTNSAFRIVTFAAVVLSALSVFVRYSPWSRRSMIGLNPSKFMLTLLRYAANRSIETLAVHPTISKSLLSLTKEEATFNVIRRITCQVGNGDSQHVEQLSIRIRHGALWWKRLGTNSDRAEDTRCCKKGCIMRSWCADNLPFSGRPATRV